MTVEALFASDIQRDVSLRVLTQFLDAWKENVECAHAKNKVTITRGKGQPPV